MYGVLTSSIRTLHTFLKFCGLFTGCLVHLLPINDMASFSVVKTRSNFSSLGISYFQVLACFVPTFVAINVAQVSKKYTMRLPGLP